MSSRNIYYVILIIFSWFVSSTAFSQKPVLPKEKKGKWGLVQGKKKITEFLYDTIQYKYSNYYVAKLNSKWGVLNHNGDEIIPFKYQEIVDLYLGILKIKLNDKYGIIDTSGLKLCETIYLEIDNFGRDSTILVKDEIHWKYIKNDIPIIRDTIVYKNPAQIATFGNCHNLNKPDEIQKCSQTKIIDIVFQNLNYPKEAVKNKVSGIVVVAFWISPNGKIEHKEILRDIGSGCGAEGLNVLDYLNDWSPALKEGKAVWSEFVLPIKYEIK